MSLQRQLCSALKAPKWLNRASRVLDAVYLDRASFSVQLFNEWLNGEPEHRIIAKFCNPSKISIDVGVAKGYYLHIFERYSAQCVGFEPNPIFYAEVHKRFPRTRIENCALSSAPGQTKLRVPLVTGVPYSGFGTIEHENTLSGFESGALREFPVEVKTLDSFNLDNIGLIKIDVEGHEWDVLSGAAATIERSRPNFMIEIEERHKPGNLAKIGGFFAQKGYGIFFLKEGRLHRLVELDAKILQNPDGPIAPDVYFNNFFFLSSPQDHRELMAA